MGTEIGETFINYRLLKDIKKAYKAGAIKEFGNDSEDEDRHISELDRRMSALDEKETYVTIKALIKSNKEVFIRTLEYLNKQEGEKQA